MKYYGYGSIIDVVDTSGINLSSINPFRYRSYYQDSETGWYYLNSRYYDPLVKRFITMDDISYLGTSGTALSYNSFSYCENNPVNNSDPNGKFSIPRSVISISIDIVIFAVLNPISSTWASITQPIKAAGRKLGKTVFKTTFKNCLLRIIDTLKYYIVKICELLVPIIKKSVGLIFKNLVKNLSVASLTASLLGALISFTANKILDSIVENITVFLSIGGLIAGALDYLTDKKLDNKIKLDFWR